MVLGTERGTRKISLIFFLLIKKDYKKVLGMPNYNKEKEKRSLSVLHGACPLMI
jgi:hypothetical protein